MHDYFPGRNKLIFLCINKSPTIGDMNEIFYRKNLCMAFTLTLLVSTGFSSDDSHGNNHEHACEGYVHPPVTSIINAAKNHSCFSLAPDYQNMILCNIHKNLKTSFYVFLIGISTHFSYGFGFLYGTIFKKK